MTSETIEAVCEHIHNYFLSAGDRHEGSFSINDGALPLDFLRPGQYFRIVGSLYNDGVHQHPAEDLRDEEFDGEIWPMRVPGAFLSVCEQIEEWQGKFEAVINSPYQSESVIGVYSYTKAATSGKGGGWENVFQASLNRWRKLS